MKIRIAILTLIFGLIIGCVKTPPDLTPEATAAFKATQAVRALDLLRDTAITANTQVPPLVTTDVTRKVVLYHQSAVKIIQAAPDGWKPALQVGLDELVKNLSPSDKSLLAPYVALVKTVLEVVQ